MPELSSVSVKVKLPNNMVSKFAITGDSIDADATHYSTIGGWNAGMSLAKNTAVGGRRTSVMLSQFDAELGGVDFDVLLIKGGTNDIGASVPTATIISNLQGIVDKCVALGKKAIVILPPPMNSQIQASSALRDAMYLYFRDKGVTCIDPFATCINTATGGFKSGYDNDGTHPSVIGDGVAGQALTTMLLENLNIDKSLSPKSNIKAGGLFSNPLMLLDSNADGWADGYGDGSPTGLTPSIVADADFVGGKAQKVSFASLTTDKYFRFLTVSFTGAPKKIHLNCKMKLDGYTSASNYVVVVSLQGVLSGRFFPATLSVLTDQTIVISADFPFVAPDNFYYVYFNIKKGAGADYSGSIRFGELQVYPVY